jgi:hypothetical protein
MTQLHEHQRACVVGPRTSEEQPGDPLDLFLSAVPNTFLLSFELQ